MLTHTLQKQNHFLLILSQLQSSSSFVYNLCKWTALILSLLATGTVLIIRFRHNTPSIPLIIADYDYSDSDDDDLEISSELEEDEEEEDVDDDEEEERTDEYFRIRGSSSSNDDGAFIRRCSIGDLLSLSEIANTKSVVKLWDSIGFGLGLGFDHFSSSDYDGVVSVYGGEGNELNGGASPAVLVSAGENTSGNLTVGVWDTRLRRRIPAVIAEWGPTVGETVRVESGDVHKVYVKDDGRFGLTVGDMRNAKSPLEFVTESNSRLDLWWPNSFIMRI